MNSSCLKWEYVEGHPGHLVVRGRDCEIYLAPRPPYCDRGSWLAQLETRPPLTRAIDEADAWPRYYFDLGRAKLEIEAWLEKRGLVL